MSYQPSHLLMRVSRARFGQAADGGGAGTVDGRLDSGEERALERGCEQHLAPAAVFRR